MDISTIDLGLDSRAITFENLTGARGRGGTAGGGRKGAPSRRIKPGERVVLVDVEGPGTVRHLWMTFPPGPPETMRGLVLEAFYDGATEPSISVPCLDFFGLPHGRPVPYVSALASAQEGRGFNSYLPWPFGAHLRVELTNASTRAAELYFQVDLTLSREGPASRLHVAWRRENPTEIGRDFVIAGGLAGPGRFAGCVVGVRVLDGGTWYGEGEVKMYRDGDTDLPTICGTGLEDYVGTAWGMGAHHALYGGAPLDVRRTASSQPDFVGFYRWHLPDPVIFAADLRVTIQQIGFHLFREGEDAEFEHYSAAHPAAGRGWSSYPGVRALGICERVDDYCAAAFIYCRDAQPVAPVDPSAALADLARLAYESPPEGEAMFG